MARIPVTLPAPLDGSVIRVTVAAARSVTTINYTTQSPQALPVGIAELGIPGLVAPTAAAELPGTCRDDLLTVDGTPVWLSVTGSTADALARHPLAVSLCGPDSAGAVVAGAGTHTVISAWGPDVGLDLDQLALASAAGAARPPRSRAASSSRRTRLRWARRRSSTRRRRGPPWRSPGSARTTPAFEFVLGQSINAGWTASAGGQDLGPPMLVDAFANGWRVDPASLSGAIHDGTLTVTLVWAPQRSVDIALCISAAVLLVCLVLAVLPLWRRRRRRRRTGSAADDRGAAGTVDAAASDLDGPQLRDPHGEGLRPSSWTVAVLTGVLYGALATAIASTLIGGLVGLAVVVVLRRPRLRFGLGVVATLLVAAIAVSLVIVQGIDPRKANGGWPSGFGFAVQLAWAAVLFLGADAVLELMDRLRRRGAGGGDGVPEDEASPVLPDA